MNNSEENNKIEVYHRLNKLKQKTGFGLNDDKVGRIDPKSITRAQNHIDGQEQEYGLIVKEILEDLAATWKELQTCEEAYRDDLIDQIYNYSNNLKDLSSTYNHDLMQHFSLSLRNFCEKIDIHKDAHKVIVQAHLDVMWITLNENLKGESSPKAEELKKIVGQAIQKFF